METVGNGNGSSYVDGYGSGDGNGYGYGSGNGDGNGSSYVDGYGSGYGDGNGEGSGNGDGNGSSYVDGSGDIKCRDFTSTRPTQKVRDSMDKLESDLESFVRICHLHEKVDMLEQALAEKDREIAKLQEWKLIILGTGTDQEAVIRMAAAEYTQVAVATWKQAYHALMGKAVRFAERLDMYSNSTILNFMDVREFLISPEVREWREQQKGKK